MVMVMMCHLYYPLYVSLLRKKTQLDIMVYSDAILYNYNERQSI